MGIVIKSTSVKNGSIGYDITKGSNTDYYGSAYGRGGSKGSLSIEVYGDSFSSLVVGGGKKYPSNKIKNTDIKVQTIVFIYKVGFDE